MPRQPSVNFPADGHKVVANSTQLGNSAVFNRPMYGTKLRCECGWTDKINVAPSRSVPLQNDLYRDHLANLPQPEPTGLAFPDTLIMDGRIYTITKPVGDGEPGWRIKPDAHNGDGLMYASWGETYDLSAIERMENEIEEAKHKIKVLRHVSIAFNREPEENTDVHTEHCCRWHGCKYADASCPVITDTKHQSFVCEECEPWYMP